MKAIFSVKLLFTFILAGLLGIAGKDDPPPIPTVGPIKVNSGGDDDLIFYPDYENCSSTSITLGVVLANLHPYGFDDEGSIIYDLPQGYEQMYLEYTIGDGPIDRVPLGSANFLSVYNNVPLYQFLVTSYPVNFTSLCEEEPLVDNLFELSYSLKIVRSLNEENTEFVDYEACNYTSECDIFSCLVNQYAAACSFVENQEPPYCLVDLNAPYDPAGDGLEFCDQSGLISSNGSLLVSCSACGDGSSTGSETGGEKSDLSHYTNKDNINVSINPNPFYNNITVEWAKEGAIESISLYDTTGKIINKWTKPDTQSSLNINTNNLTKGLYFLKVNTTVSSKVFKLVKQ